MGKDKGDKKGKFPKRVAGVKVPKAVRKGAEALVAQAQSETGRAAILQGVSVVAGIAATAAKAAAQSAAAKAAKPEATVPPTPTPTPPGPPSDAIAQAVNVGLDALGKLFPKR